MLKAKLYEKLEEDNEALKFIIIAIDHLNKSSKPHPKAVKPQQKSKKVKKKGISQL